jgi:hypothetical protein
MGMATVHDRAFEIEREIARTDVGTRMETALGPAFGGAWFEPSEGRVHIGVISPTGQRAVESVAAHAGLGEVVTATSVAVTWRQLEDAQTRIDGEVADLFARGEVKTSLSAARNAVEVELGSAVPEARQAALRRNAAAAGAPVSFKVVPDSDLTANAEARCKEFEEDKANCDKPIVAGVTIEGATGEICTAGPAAILQDLSTGEKATATYLLTAGHCLKELGGGVGTKWYGFTKKKGEEGEKQLIGEAEQFLKGEEGAAKVRVDIGLIKINNPGNWVHEGADKATPVTPGIVPWDPTKEVEPIPIVAQGPKEPMVGTQVCVSGQTSGTSCGKVINSSVTETFKKPSWRKMDRGQNC